MSQTPLTDRPALLRQRARALRAPALFLHALAAEETEDRRHRFCRFLAAALPERDRGER
jgi:hypothetical protein